MQTRKKLLVVLSAFTCAACATPMTDKAAKVQVHRQMSTLLADCKKIGPVSARGEGTFGEDAFDAAKRQAREQAANMGADTIAITDAEGTPFKANVQAVALHCY